MRCIFVIIMCLTSNALMACDSNGILMKPLIVKEVASEAILNGSSMSMYDITSPKCNIDCYSKFIGQHEFEFLLKGTVLSVHNDTGFLTMSIENNSKQGFNGKVVCKPHIQYKQLSIPRLPIIDKPKTDFKAKDAAGISRTLVYPRISKNVFRTVVSFLVQSSHKYELDENISYFKLKSGLEAQLTYQTQHNVGTLIIVFMKKGN